jgi:hypothetical protein
MTELELNRKLALAIGWREDQMRVVHGELQVAFCPEIPIFMWEEFDHTDWQVAGPIAESRNMFPCQDNAGKWSSDCWITEADTPQRAIALAAI